MLFFAQVSQVGIVSFWLIVLLVLFGFAGLLWLGYWFQNRPGSTSPYTKLPLRPCEQIPYLSAKKILKYLYDNLDYDNRPFELSKASFCRETGRIFPDSITWFDTIHVDWTFLQKRYPGHYVSWGSLTQDQKLELLTLHGSLAGFQTELSSENPSPRQVEEEFAYAKPGPLYVNLENKVLLGWKCIPDSDFEVLVVQRPLQIHIQTGIEENAT